MERLLSRRSSTDAIDVSKRLVLAIAAAASLLPTLASAQGAGAWPVKPIRLVSPFNPGGAIDVLNRILAEKLSQRLGQQVFVDPIPGANTIKGADVVADRFGLPRPPRLARADAVAALSPLQMSFLGESRRLINRRMKAELRLTLRHPTVAAGLDAPAARAGDGDNRRRP